MENENTVSVSVKLDGEFVQYSKFTVKVIKTGHSYFLSGFYDGDMCNDLRQEILEKTKNGENSDVKLNWTQDNIARWIASHHEFVIHYAPY